uniref:SHSP domain-containing protein n=1 Tax=Hanusia phi TaxID=3032 RepID=A0A7S0HKS6_9CRYP
MAGGAVRLEFYGVGSWVCQGGSSKFIFSPQFDGIFESNDRPRTTQGVLPPSPSVFARSHLRSSSRWIPPTPPRSRPHSSGKLEEPILSSSPHRRKATPTREQMQEQANFPSRPFSHQSARSAKSVDRDLVGTPSSGKRLRMSQQAEEDVRVLRVEEQGMQAGEVEILIRNGELVVRQESIGLQRSFPLSSRADVERIEASIKQGILEIRIPDKTRSLRSFYDSQIREREGMKKVEEEVDTMLLEQTKRRNEEALESEKEMQDARRRARREIEDFNRKLITQKQQRRRVFEPESCGFLLYNRTEAKSRSLPPQVLRSLLDAQVRDKQELVAQAKEAEREQVLRETAELKESLEEEERKAREEKRIAQMARREELRHQVETLQPRLPGAFSALCNFPRRDEESDLRELKKKEVKKVYDEVVEMVNTRELQSMQMKKTMNLQEMEEMEEIKQSIEEEEEEKRRMDATQKVANRETWRKQINDRREKVRSQLLQGHYATSLPVGEAELELRRSIRPEVVAA